MLGREGRKFTDPVNLVEYISCPILHIKGFFSRLNHQKEWCNFIILVCCSQDKEYCCFINYLLGEKVKNKGVICIVKTWGDNCITNIWGEKQNVLADSFLLGIVPSRSMISVNCPSMTPYLILHEVLYMQNLQLACL